MGFIGSQKKFLLKSELKNLIENWDKSYEIIGRTLSIFQLRFLEYAYVNDKQVAVNFKPSLNNKLDYLAFEIKDYSEAHIPGTFVRVIEVHTTGKRPMLKHMIVYAVM